jgi:hypothetical protein
MGSKGYDGGKHIKGRKRYLLVDTLGLVLAAVVTAANLSDKAGLIIASPTAKGVRSKTGPLPISPTARPKRSRRPAWALRYKDDLGLLGALTTSHEVQAGRAVGAVYTVYHLAQRLGIDKALGTDFAGKLALWQVIARVLNQGSRLSAVRLAHTHAACELLQFPRGFDENDLYDTGLG